MFCIEGASLSESARGLEQGISLTINVQKPTVNHDNLLGKKGGSLQLVAPTILGWGLSVGWDLLLLTKVEMVIVCCCMHEGFRI